MGNAFQDQHRWLGFRVPDVKLRDFKTRGRQLEREVAVPGVREDLPIAVCIQIIEEAIDVMAWDAHI